MPCKFASLNKVSGLQMQEIPPLLSKGSVKKLFLVVMIFPHCSNGTSVLVFFERPYLFSVLFESYYLRCYLFWLGHLFVLWAAVGGCFLV